MSTEHNKTQREKMFGGVGKSIEQSEKVLSPVLGRLNLFKNINLLIQMTGKVRYKK
jgi:adhesin transport system membrane fusion protein